MGLELSTREIWLLTFQDKTRLREYLKSLLLAGSSYSLYRAVCCTNSTTVLFTRCRSILLCSLSAFRSSTSPSSSSRSALKLSLWKVRDEFVKVCFLERHASIPCEEAFIILCFILDKSNKLHTLAGIGTDSSEPSFFSLHATHVSRKKIYRKFMFRYNEQFNFRFKYKYRQQNFCY